MKDWLNLVVGTAIAALVIWLIINAFFNNPEPNICSREYRDIYSELTTTMTSFARNAHLSLGIARTRSSGRMGKQNSIVALGSEPAQIFVRKNPGPMPQFAHTQEA